MKRAIQTRTRRTALIGAAIAAIVGQVAAAQSVQFPEWERRHPGGSWGSEVPSHTRSIHVGNDGTIYATGRFNDDTIKLLVVAYAPDGTQLWDFVWGQGGTYDIGDAITTDDEGNVYVSMECLMPGDQRAMGVLSLTPTGQFRWFHKWVGQGIWCCFGADITVGQDGHVYVTGSYQGPGMSNAQSRVGTLSLTKDGAVRWERAWVLPIQDGTGVGWRVATDEFGDVYVAGRSSNHFIVLSFTPDGDERWWYAKQAANSASNEAMGLAVGADGNIYAAGRLDGPVDSRGLYVVSLTRNGEYRWDYLYNGSAGLSDRANALIWGSDGNLYAGGKVVESVPFSFEAMFIVSLMPDGQERWRHYETFSEIGSPPLAIRTVRGLASDGAGNVYAAGYNYHAGQVRYAAMSVTPDGEPRWVFVGDGGMSEHVVTRDDRAYVVGIMNADGDFNSNRHTVTAFEADAGGIPCPVDCNGDGEVNSLDFICFLNLFVAADPAADCNGDGEVNSLDFICFLNAFNAGCP